MKLITPPKPGLILAVTASTLLTGSLFTGGCGSRDDNKAGAAKKKPPIVAVETVRKEPIARILELTGSVEPYRVARLASPAEGPIADIHVREGDTVEAGAALLSIGRKKGIAALITSLKEELQKEEDNLRRVQQLVESKALPEEQISEAKAAYEKARALLVKAEETAQDYVISAPWSGIVSRVIVKEGEFVAPRAALLEMFDPASLVIRSAVPEKHALEVSVGMRCQLSLDAYRDDALQGRIERVYPHLDSRLRTRTIEISLDKPVPLLPGMFARLKMETGRMEDAVAAPMQAVIVSPKGARTVFVAADGKARQREVQTGIEEKGRVQILSGLTPGEKVIVAGQEKLKDGAAIRLPGPPKNGQAAGKPHTDVKRSR